MEGFKRLTKTVLEFPNYYDVVGLTCIVSVLISYEILFT